MNYIQKSENSCTEITEEVEWVRCHYKHVLCFLQIVFIDIGLKLFDSTGDLFPNGFAVGVCADICLSSAGRLQYCELFFAFGL